MIQFHFKKYYFGATQLSLLRACTCIKTSIYCNSSRKKKLLKQAIVDFNNKSGQVNKGIKSLFLVSFLRQLNRGGTLVSCAGKTPPAFPIGLVEKRRLPDYHCHTYLLKKINKISKFGILFHIQIQSSFFSLAAKISYFHLYSQVQKIFLFPLLKLFKLKITPHAQCSISTIKQTQPLYLQLTITNYSLFGSDLTIVVRVKENFYHSL